MKLSRIDLIGQNGNDGEHYMNSTTERAVIEWANQLGIFDKATPQAQFVKMVEEVGEIAECIAKGRSDDIALEIGDLLVTAILLAKLYGYEASGCLDRAYRKIADRTGKVVGGVFIKDGD